MQTDPNQPNQYQPIYDEQTRERLMRENQPPMFPSQPFQSQPQMPPFQPVPQPMPKKKSTFGKIAPFVIVGLICYFLGLAVGTNTATTSKSADTTTTTASRDNSTGNTQPTQANVTPTPVPPTPTPKPAPTWQTTHTYSGNGAKKTETITVPNDWKLQWTCDPASFGGTQYNVAVTVTSPDNNPVDLAVNTLCSDTNSSGSTEEHQGGQVFLDVSSEAAWTLTIQELK